MKKRICSLLISVVMLLTMLPMAAGASDIVAQGTDPENENIEWIVYEDGTLYVSGYGDVGYCEGGSPFNLGYDDMNRITKIRVFGLKDGIIFNDRFFESCRSATKITFNGAVNYFDSGMFPESIQEVSVPDNNRYFETVDGVLYSKNNEWTKYGEFSRTHHHHWLTKETVPDGYSLLYYPEGKIDSTYKMPTSVEGIALGAFYNGNKYLESVSLSQNCSRIEHDLNWSEFPQLKRISCLSNENFMSDGAVLYTIDKSEIVWFPDNYRHSHYDIPETVKEVDMDTFYFAPNLKSVTIPAQTKIIQTSFPPDAASVDFSAEHFELHFEGNAPDCSPVEPFPDRPNVFYPVYSGVGWKTIPVDVYYNVNTEGWDEIIGYWEKDIKSGVIELHPQDTPIQPEEPEPSAIELTFNTFDGQANISIVDRETVGDTITLRDEASVTFDDMRFIGWRDTSSGIDYAPGAAYIVPNHNVRFEARFESISASEPDMETPSISDNGNDNETETEERSSRRARRKSDNSSSDRESASVDEEKTSDGPQITEPQFAPEQPEVTAAAQAPVFADVPAHEWYAAATDYVTSRGLMTGTSAASFSPNVTMTRAMLWTVLARADGADTDGGAAWYDNGLAWAQSNGVSDGSNPDGMVTREQIASMLYRTAKASADSGNLSGYPDSGKVSDWAMEAMQWAVASGLITGKSSGALDPQGAATRAEVAQILMRYQQNGTMR